MPLNNPLIFRKITDIARAQEDKTARAIKRVLDWSTAEVLKALQRGESGEAIIEEIAPKFQTFLYAVKHQNVMEVAVPAYKVARALVAANRRENVMVRGKATMFSLPGFDDEELIRQYINVDIEGWLQETSRMETATTKKDLSNAVRKAWEAGEFPGEIESLTQTFAEIMDDRTDVRSEMLAITITNWAANQAAVLHYKENNVNYLEWLTAEDEMVCPYCRDMDGEIIPIGSPFARTGDIIHSADSNGRAVQMRVGVEVNHPPLHPRCRCVALAVLP